MMVISKQYPSTVYMQVREANAVVSDDKLLRAHAYTEQYGLFATRRAGAESVFEILINTTNTNTNTSNDDEV